MTTQPAKETVYIDAEDEITAIIEKVRSAQGKIVALVLPKRSATLQSVVNLKLLKRMAGDAKKNLVLITSDKNLLPLAGSVGLHVAKTLQSKPSIPTSPNQNDAAITIDSDEGALDDDGLDTHMSVGELAGQLAAEETIELDNDVSATEPVAVVGNAKAKRNKKLKIPDFDRFRLVLFGGIALLLVLLVGGYFALVVLPKASITIKTDTSTIDTDLKLTANTEAKTINAEQGVVPGVSKQVKKSDSEKVPATGKRDEGTKATGTMTLTNCINDGASHTVPAGTGFSSGQATFVTDSAVTLDPALYAASVCKSATLGLSKTVPVTSTQAGDQYNLGSRGYSSPASLTTSSGSITATGSDMKGGSSKIVQIVSQQDIDIAKQKVMDRVAATAASELKTQFSADNALALVDTIAAGEPVVTSSPNINDAAADVNVNVTITYTELGVKQDDVKQLIEADVKKHIDNSKQVIQDNGLSKAVLRLLEKVSGTQAKFEIQTTAVAGAQLDADGIKKQIAGKKKGATQSLILARPGMKDVNIKYSPFWVFSTPKKTSHITITFEQNGGK